MADPLFYDTLGSSGTAHDFAIATREALPGWVRGRNDEWVSYGPHPSGLPEQGWKIHVSGRTDNAERLLGTVWDYCVSRGLAWKFLRSAEALFLRNAKYAFRGGSGKLATIYPRDEDEAALVCKELDDLLGGEAGPYILSDLRFGDGPLYLRYGGFAPLTCPDAQGRPVPAIRDPSGGLVPDVRGPVFALPAWVDLPDFLVPHLAARNAVTIADLPYEITEALHHSNGGGVYLGHDRRTGERVVLKEARPHAGLSAGGIDAVQRLRRERDILERLAGIDAVPRLLDYLTVGEHEFLVEEYIEGTVLSKAVSARHPLLRNTLSPAAAADHAAWATRIHAAVTRAVEAIHRRGVVYGDLHLFNVIVRPDGRIALVDFEVAADAEAGERPGLGAAGFAAPRDVTGFDIDRYALACLRLALFLPLTSLLRLDPGKAAQLAGVIAELFPVQEKSLNVFRGGHRRQRNPMPEAWPELRDRMAAAILDSATLARDDRLFPGDIAQFQAGGLNLAHGAAGVLWALDVTGVGRHEPHEEWLIARCGRSSRRGFYDGLHGMAYALDHLGHRQEALGLLDRALSRGWQDTGLDLFGGLAGVGLNCAHFADRTGDAAFADAATRATAVIADRIGRLDDVAPVSGGEHPQAGLMHGASGRALLLVRMFERTGDGALLDLAAIALRQDLRRCVRLADGQLHVNEGWRTMPYLATGSVGIGLVIEHYLRHRHDDELADAADGIRRAASCFLYSQSGLFQGRAGMILHLRRSPEAAAQIRRLAWHAVDPRGSGHLAFPGEQLLRLSMDLATGTAGVLLAVAAALHDHPVHLPFLRMNRPRLKGGDTDGTARSAEPEAAQGR